MKKGFFSNKPSEYFVGVYSVVLAFLLITDILSRRNKVVVLAIFSGIGAIIAWYKTYQIKAKKTDKDFGDAVLGAIGLTLICFMAFFILIGKYY